MSNDTEISKNNPIEIIDFITKPCPYSLYGDHPLVYTPFYCQSCDPQQQNQICEECITTCHKDCDNKSTEQTEKSEKKDFLCSCGKNMHIVVPKTEKEDVPLNQLCTIKSIPALKNNFYKCSKCNKTACFICIKKCHTDCKDNNDTSEALEGSSFQCECNSQIHYYNDFLFQEPFDCSGFKCDGLNLFQIIYYQCEVGSLDKFLEVFEKLGSKEKIENFDSYEKEFGKNLQTFPSTKIQKSLFIYHPKLTKAFSADFILKRISVKDTEFNILNTYYFYFFYFHLINDFQNVPKFSAYNYQNSSFKDHGEYTKILHFNIPEEIQKKYAIYKHGAKNLKKTSKFDIQILIHKILDNFTVRLTFRQEYAALLTFKIIYYTLIYQMYTIDELDQLVGKIYLKFDQIYKDFRQNESDVYTPLMKKYYNTIIKMFYLICISYNDLVYLEYLKGNKTYTFIHSKNEIGDMLLMMILRINERVISENFRIPNFKSSTILFYNELLSLFILAENKYSRDLFKGLQPCLTVDTRSAVFQKVSEFEKAVQQSKMNIYLGKEKDTCIAFSDIIKEFLNSLLTVTGSSKANPKFMNPKLLAKVKYFISESFPEAKDLPYENIGEDLSIALRATNVLETVLRIGLGLAKPGTDCKPQNIEAIISLTLLLNFNRDILNSLISGKLLDLVSLLCPRTNNFLLEYYYLLFKGITMYGIKFENHKYLLKAINTIKDYIAEKSNYVNSSKMGLTYCFKILSLQSYNIDFEELKYLKIIALANLKTSDISLNNFKLIFNEDEQFSLADLKQKMKDELVSFYNNKENQNDEAFVGRKSFLPLISEEARINNFVIDACSPKLTINKFPDLKNKEPHELSKEEKRLLELKFYITFFDFIAKDLNYFIKDELFETEIETVKTFNNLQFFRSFLQKNNISLNQRKTLLNYIITFYLSPIVNDKKTIKEILSYDPLNTEGLIYLTTTEYFQIHNSAFSLLDESSVKQKLEVLNEFTNIMEIFENEIENLKLLTYDSLDSKFTRIKEYITLLLKYVRYISDFFISVKNVYGEQFSNHMSLKYYKLAEIFLKEYSIFLVLINPDKKESLKFDFLKVANSPPSNDYYNKLKTIKTYFDLPFTYEVVLTALKSLYPYLDEKVINLENHLIKFDNITSKEYFSKSLIYKGNYHIFYRNVKTGVDIKPTNQIYQEYINQFTNIDNTNLMINLNTLTGEDELFYTNIFRNYFIKYISSYYHISENFDLTIFKIITKLFYYNNTKMQQSFSSEKQTVNVIGNLFIILNGLLNIITECSANVFTYKRYSKFIQLKAMLILRLFQSFGIIIVHYLMIFL
jgi:hypothetical protein